MLWPHVHVERSEFLISAYFKPQSTFLNQVKLGTTADFLTARAENQTVDTSLALHVYTWQTFCRVDVAYSGCIVGND